VLSAEDNELLVRTDRGTGMGELLRRYWLPFLLSEQLREPDGPQVRVKLLGEELLAFRDSSGRAALIARRCAHRGADLYFARNEDGGVRCAYHGWKYDADGHCVDVPTVDPQRAQAMCARAKLTAYPVREWGGMLWAYLGPAEHCPELPHLEAALVPESHRFVSKKLQECNWAQAVEGALDTAHFSFLHQPVTRSAEVFKEQAARAVRGFSPVTMSDAHVRWMRDDPRPAFHVVPHQAGLMLAASRVADDDQLYWRVSQFLMPCHGYTPSAAPGQTMHAQTWVPIDDESCWVYVYSWNPQRALTDDERASFRSGGAVYSEVDEHWIPLRNRSNDYLLDRALQKTESFVGIRGVSEQDAAIQDSQGRIADRTTELLGATDIGVVQFRRLMLESARALRQGIEPPSATLPDSYRVRAGSIVIDKAVAFEEAMIRRFGDACGRIVA
jgi:phthalate 4,5-dioxygenase